MDTTEKRFESDVKTAFLSLAGGYARGTDTYAFNLGPCVPIISTASTAALLTLSTWTTFCGFSYFWDYYFPVSTVS